jgi:hypothetical protein
MIAESLINRKSRGRKLPTDRVSRPRGVPEGKKTLTLTEATKVSFHEPPLNFDFTHSLKSGMGDEGRAVSPLFSGVERHRCKISGARCRMHNGGTGNMTYQGARR